MSMRVLLIMLMVVMLGFLSKPICEGADKGVKGKGDVTVVDVDNKTKAKRVDVAIEEVAKIISMSIPKDVVQVMVKTQDTINNLLTRKQLINTEISRLNQVKASAFQIWLASEGIDRKELHHWVVGKGNLAVLKDKHK